MKLFYSILIIIFLGYSEAYAAGLAKVENDIVQSVNSQNQTGLLLLEKIVNINSGTTNPPGVHTVGEILRPEFEKLGFKTYWVEEPPSMQRAGTLFAERMGHSGKRLLLIAHLDTVFSKNSPFQRFKKDAHFAYGPGVVDDKGGIIVILNALKALNSVHALDDVTITVALVGDEEDSGKPTTISRKSLIDAAKRSDVALDFECSLSLDTATIARRGISRFKIETTGSGSHSAQIFKKEIGFGAIYEMARILNSLRETLARQKDLSANPGVILGGTKMVYNDKTEAGSLEGKDNIIAKMALVDSDLRFISREQQVMAQKLIQKIVNQHLPGTHALVTFQNGIPAMAPTAANKALLALYSTISLDLGEGKVSALPVGDRGAGDISHVANWVPANLAGLGPLSAGDGAHSQNEGLSLRSLPIVTKRAAVLIYRLTHVQR